MTQLLEDSTTEARSEVHSSTRAAWDQIAPGYDRTNTLTQMRIGALGLQRARLRAGMYFLDVAAGSGALSVPAAHLGARVLATDQSPVMLQLLAIRSRRERLGIECRVMNGEALELPDDAFDVSGSQFGVMLFPDMPKGIRELARVTSPGGRVLLTSYGDPHQIDFLDFFVRAVRTVRAGFTGPPVEPPPLPFQLQDPLRLRALMAAAGLQDVSVETVVENTEFKTGKELWDWIRWSNPIVESILRDLQVSEEEAVLIETALEALVRERAGKGDTAILNNPVNIGVGTKVAHDFRAG